VKFELTDEAGFGYTFFNEEVNKLGLDEFSGSIKDVDHHLLFQPGKRFNYGVYDPKLSISMIICIDEGQTSVDWAGVIVERVSNLSLHDYCVKNIFQPLGIEKMSFFPPKEKKDHLARMHQRLPSGELKEREHLLLRPLLDQTPEQIKETLNSAGAGIFAQPREYVKIISTLLNNGTSPTTGKQILKKETVDEMFTNQIPSMPNFGREGISAAIPELTNPISELYPQPMDQAQGWGLTFMITIHPAATGRGKNTGWWAGLPNLFWWADRENGVGGMVASQILPFADPKVLGLWVECEQLIYQG